MQETSAPRLDETLSDAAKRVTALNLFALRINARPEPQLLLQPGAYGTFHIVKAWIEAGIRAASLATP